MGDKIKNELSAFRAKAREALGDVELRPDPYGMRNQWPKGAGAYKPFNDRELEAAKAFGVTVAERLKWRAAS